MPTKQQILGIAHGVPVSVLIKYINNGVITLQDLEQVHLPQPKLDAISRALQGKEDEMWQQACASGSVIDFFRYLNSFPNGVYAEACRQALISGEEDFWYEVLSIGSPEMLQQYINVYELLGGNHVAECQEMINDPEWIQVKKNPTLSSLDEYMRSHPGSHTTEIASMRDNITDDVDWDNANKAANSDAYRAYLAKHPQGRWAYEAQSRINAAAGRDAFVSEMRADINDKTPEEIQYAVNNNIITWADVESVYGPKRTMAIQNFIDMPPIDVTQPPKLLQPDSTEIYFWGTPSSGKTCALGSLLSGAENYYNLEAQLCQGFHYMTRLKGVFRPNQLCSLPPSTSVDEIQEMIFTLYDRNSGKLHKMTFIDLAGEIFRAIYFNLIGQIVDEQHMMTLNHVQNFLLDKRNPKIHFFVVEYGAENKQWENIYMKDYLSTCALYVKENKILKRSTGVYILVTKCDKIGNDIDLVAQAEQYVQDYLPSFYNNLNNACIESGIKDFQVIPFSIGNVFASKICEYDDSFVYDVLDTLLYKTPAIRGGILWK